MRADIFQNKKCVHIKLDKAVHAQLRAELFKRDMSMQEVFDDYASAIVSGDFRAVRLLEQFTMSKIERRLQGITRRETKPISELDTDALYKLIEGNDKGDRT